MRDLKADLEAVQKAKEFERVTGWGSEEFVRLAPYFRNFHENGMVIAEHALERAIKAEDVCRFFYELYAVIHTTEAIEEGVDGDATLQSFEEWMDEEYSKAKKVLEDD